MAKRNNTILLIGGIAAVGLIYYAMTRPKTITTTTPGLPTTTPGSGINPLTSTGQGILNSLLGSGNAAAGVSTIGNWLSGLFGSGNSTYSSAGSNVADPTYNTPYIPPGANDYPGMDLSSQDMTA